MKIDIVDNFLTSYQVDTLVKIFNGKARGSGLFPWLFINDLNDVEYIGNYYFSKNIVEEWVVLDDYWIHIFDPLLAKLNISTLSVYRLKVNMHPGTQRRVNHAVHRDYGPDFGLRTALYYVNDTNGPTVFGTGWRKTKVECKRNRVALFDGSIPHHSTTPTNSNWRCTINIDYKP